MYKIYIINVEIESATKGTPTLQHVQYNILCHICSYWMTISGLTGWKRGSTMSCNIFWIISGLAAGGSFWIGMRNDTDDGEYNHWNSGTQVTFSYWASGINTSLLLLSVNLDKHQTRLNLLADVIPRTF